MTSPIDQLRERRTDLWLRAAMEVEDNIPGTQIIRARPGDGAVEVFVEHYPGCPPDVCWHPVREKKPTVVVAPVAQPSWRSRPASEVQKLALRRSRVRYRPGITAGEASDIITAKTARLTR